MEWFSVHKEGLAALVKRRPPATAVSELIQNALDTAAKVITVVLTKSPGELAHLVVTDDDPHGFTDLAHAFTLFAPSEKGADASKRGRFNLGEKLVLALCARAVIRTVGGAVVFDTDGRHDAPELATSVGSVFEADIDLSDSDVAEVAELIRRLIVPKRVRLSYNGERIAPRTPAATCRVKLPTEVADADGVLKRTTRATTVGLHPVAGGETPMIYELGIPVVDWDGPLHVDVGQKVPVNFERNNVTPGYLGTLRVTVLNAIHDTLTPEQLTAAWISPALEDERISAEALRAVYDGRHGQNAVVYDPSDPQAHKEAAAAGLPVVGPRTLSGRQWAVVRAKDPELLRPAGQVTPSRAREELTDADTETYEPTAAMQRILDYAVVVARNALGVEITARCTNRPQSNAAATYSPDRRVMSFNVGRLGKNWFENPDPESVDALLVHELGHEVYDVADHLDRHYYDGLCVVAAKMRRVPVLFETFNPPTPTPTPAPTVTGKRARR